MDGDRRRQLEEIMADLAEDEAGVIALYQTFGAEIGAVVRFEANKVAPGMADADDIEAMVVDACLALARVAGAWRPDGGALPWVWARARITAVVRSALPQPMRTLPDEADLPPAAPLLGLWAVDGVDVRRSLRVLARRDPRVALLADALDESVSPDDADVWLRYRIQQQSGDPSAANTVAEELGMQPPAVRQRASRARRRLHAFIAANPRYAAISDLPLLASPAA